MTLNGHDTRKVDRLICILSHFEEEDGAELGDILRGFIAALDNYEYVTDEDADELAVISMRILRKALLESYTGWFTESLEVLNTKLSFSGHKKTNTLELLGISF